MFNSLSGIITGKSSQRLFLDTHGIEWDIAVPDSSLEKLPEIGKEGRVFVWMQHTDVLMSLFGFSSDEERSVFFELLKVDGIGPKAALKIMSGVTSQELSLILENDDIDRLEKLPGIGKKTAAKMMLQLKGHLHLEKAECGGAKKEMPFADVVAGLASMGYDRRQAEEAVLLVAEKIKNEENAEKLGKKEKEDLVFRKALVELAK